MNSAAITAHEGDLGQGHHENLSLQEYLEEVRGMFMIDRQNCKQGIMPEATKTLLTQYKNAGARDIHGITDYAIKALCDKEVVEGLDAFTKVLVRDVAIDDVVAWYIWYDPKQFVVSHWFVIDERRDDERIRHALLGAAAESQKQNQVISVQLRIIEAEDRAKPPEIYAKVVDRRAEYQQSLAS